MPASFSWIKAAAEPQTALWILVTVRRRKEEHSEVSIPMMEGKELFWRRGMQSLSNLESQATHSLHGDHKCHFADIVT